MENNQNSQYDFCPKCGALTKEGVCTNCEKAIEPVEAVENVQTMQVQSSYPVNNGYIQEQPIQNPYMNYQGNYYGYQIPSGNQKEQTKKNNTIAIIIVGVILVFIILLVLLGYFIYASVKEAMNKIEENQKDYNNYYNYEDYNDDYHYDYDYDDNYYDDYDFYDDYYNDDYFGDYGYNENSEGKTYGSSPEDDYYKELTTILNEELDYKIEFKLEEYRDEEHNTSIDFYYPVISGDIPNADALNAAVFKEYEAVLSYFESEFWDYMQEDEYLYAELECFVTYMDEKVLSIVVSEELLGTYIGEGYLYSINIDVEKGVILNNTEILEVNDDFSVDFRTRDEAQNSGGLLNYYTDQQVTEMLKNEENLILFYTPLGLEVGVNCDYGWVTVTYKDYEDFLKSF